MYRLRHNIVGKNLEKAIDFLFLQSSHFSLTIKKFYIEDDANDEERALFYQMTDKRLNTRADETERLLYEHLVTKVTSKFWFDMFYGNRPEELTTIWIFNCSDETKYLLKNWIHDFYENSHNEDFKFEDICFFKDKNLVLGSITHEGYVACCLDVPKTILSDLGEWDILKENVKCKMTLDEDFQVTESYIECFKRKVLFNRPFLNGIFDK